MRSRVPAVLLLLAAFLLGPAPGGIHPPATAPTAIAASVTGAPAAWWSSPTVHAEQDTALLRLHPARGIPALPVWLAVLPSCGQPDPHAPPITTVTSPHAAAPQTTAGLAPARAPPSTTR
ncbi:hypothetical protein [Nonomuraea sp. NPDC049695]|uniref:hypothetical protein n=1 Tax=Nonomuraea sp. NPDC049695 TaxID=3154734 RepID=UPI003444F569